jgi:Outer membrane protein beta-barrel domain
MKLATLIAISAVASILTQTSVFAQEAPAPAVAPTATPAEVVPAQEKSAEKSSGTPAQSVPVPEKKYSIGPALEFGGGGTSFGIKANVSISENFSVRPLILFGYKPLSNSDVSKFARDRGLVRTNAEIDQAVSEVGTGTAYGLALTYDFKSPDSKILGYVGPRILVGTASGSGAGFTTSTSEANIGLTAGANYAISPDFTAGLDATYNFSRSAELSSTSSGVTVKNTLSPDPSFKFGLNILYNF